jgi:hypothetical protein
MLGAAPVPDEAGWMTFTFMTRPAHEWRNAAPCGTALA